MTLKRCILELGSGHRGVAGFVRAVELAPEQRARRHRDRLVPVRRHHVAQHESAALEPGAGRPRAGRPCAASWIAPRGLS